MVQITDIVYEMSLTGFSGNLDDIDDGTTYGKVDQTALDNGLIDLGGAGITGDLPATALVEGVQPFVSNITFVPKVGDTHDSISWGAGTITFSDGSSLAIDAGSFDDQTEVTHWIYFTIGSSSLSTTTTYSDCVGGNKGPLCLYAVSSDATQQVLIRPFYSKGLNIQADVIAALAIQTLHLAAQAVTAAKIQAGTITANEMSFTAYDLAVHDLDDVDDGTSYSRVLTTDITAGHILLSAATGDLDDISDGTSYGRIDITDIQSGHILLTTVIGDLDDISEGTNYGKVAITDIQSGHILLSTTVGDLSDIDGDLDDIGDGTSYGRIDITDIQSGHIILSTTIGDLDDVDDGTTYGKVAVTDISAGKIKLTTSQNMDSQGFEIVSNTGTTRIEITDVHIAGYNADVLQFELDATNGKAYAGGGAVILDSYGITIIEEALKFKGTTNLRGIIYGRETQHTLDITAYEDMDINVLGGGAPLGDLTLNAQGSVRPPINSAGFRDLGKPGYAWRFYVPITTLGNRPAAHADYAGLVWITEQTTGDKSFIWVCMRNDVSVYEWVQLGVTT